MDMTQDTYISSRCGYDTRYLCQ